MNKITISNKISKMVKANEDNNNVILKQVMRV